MTGALSETSQEVGTRDAVLFRPLQVGRIFLKHRVIMAPLTRSRSIQPDSIPGDLMARYYTQRASDGGLIIAEATNISLTSRGWLGAPGLYTDEQVEGWGKIVRGVHAKGGHIFAQLWHTGRSSHVSMTGGAVPVSASVDPDYWAHPSHLVSIPGGWVQPSPHRALTVAEIGGIVHDYRRAAERAMEAGFEGVELHSANGYLIDQFLRGSANLRDDRYGGSIANRIRLLSEVTGAVAGAIGADRTGVRLSPNGDSQGVNDSDPEPLFAAAADALSALGIAFLELREPPADGTRGRPDRPPVHPTIRKHFKGPLVLNSDFDGARAQAALDRGDADAIAFGRGFLANPDLPYRLAKRLPLTPDDMATWYTQGAVGYTDYPTAARV